MSTVLNRPRTWLILKNASQLILTGVLAEVSNEQRVAWRVVLCVRDRNIASWLHRYLQKGRSFMQHGAGIALPCKPSLGSDCSLLITYTMKSRSLQGLGHSMQVQARLWVLWRRGCTRRPLCRAWPLWQGRPGCTCSCEPSHISTPAVIGMCVPSEVPQSHSNLRACSAASVLR